MIDVMWGDFIFVIASLIPIVLVIVLITRLKKRGERLRTLEQRIEQLEKTI